MLGSFPASEVHFVPALFEARAPGFGCFQLQVATLDFGHSPAGVTDPNTPNLIRGSFQAVRDGVDDVCFDCFPVGGFPGPLQPGYGLVVTPPGGVKPQPECLALRLRRINPNPP